MKSGVEMSRNFIFQIVPQKYLESVQIHLQTTHTTIATINVFENSSPNHTGNETNQMNKLSPKRKRNVIKIKRTQYDIVTYEQYGIPRCCLKNCLKEVSLEELMKLRQECHELKKIDKKLFIKNKIMKSADGKGP